jgi:hypothetical protein
MEPTKIEPNNLMEAQEKIETVLSHIQNVQKNCYKLGLRLIKAGQIEMGRNLIANGQIHDNSKFKGIEFDHLFFGDPILSDVIKHHSSTNPHHPEYWGDTLHKMPDIYIAEFVCDTASRSAEFGTDIRDWLSKVATDKYKFHIDDETGKKVMYFLNMLLEQPFKKN